MNPFFEWLIKSSVSIALLYSVFKLVVSRDKIFLINRFVLLGILFLSALLPLMDVPIFQKTVVIPKIEVFRDFVTPTIVSNVSIITEPASTALEPNSFQISPWLVFYLLIILSLSIRLFISVFRVIQIIRQAEKQPFQKIILAIVKDFIQPFSFLQHIIISQKDFSENRDIVIAHEYAHIKHLHVIDLVICELFTALHWFNPLMWLLRRDLKLIHEYQADQAVLNKGIDAKKYQLLVVEKAVGERRFAMAHHFTQKPILKRIKMMHRKNENYWKGVKVLFFAPVVLLLLQAFAQPEVLSEKLGEIVPSIAQKDSSDIWLDNWTIENLSKVNEELQVGEVEIAPPPPPKQGSQTVSSQSGLVKYDKSGDGLQIPTTNILQILVNRNNELLSVDRRVNKDELLEGVKKFLNGNPPYSSIKKGPEVEVKDLLYVGNVKVSKGVIVLRYDLDADNGFINNLLRSVGKLHLEKRDLVANEKFGQNYFSLPADKKKVIDQIVPVRVSFIEPKITSNRKSQSNNSGINQKMVTAFSVLISGNDKIDLDEIRENAELAVKNSNGDISANIMSYIKISDEDYNSIKEVLQKAGIKQISRLKPPPPPPPAKIDLNLKKNGKVLWGNDEFSYSEVEQKLVEIKSNQEQTYKKYNMKPEMVTSVKIDVGVTEEQINALKEALRKAKVLNVNYSTDSNGQSTSDRSGELKPPPPPPPPNIINLTLQKDGKVLFGKEEYSISEVEQKIVTLKKERDEMYEKWNLKPELVTSVKIETGVTDALVSSLKDALRKAKVSHVNYSTDSKDQTTSERSGELKPPPLMFWVGLSNNKIFLSNKEISIAELEKKARSFMESVKNDYYLRVAGDSDVSPEEFETVTNVLKKLNIPESKILCIVDDDPNN